MTSPPSYSVPMTRLDNGISSGSWFKDIHQEYDPNVKIDKSVFESGGGDSKQSSAGSLKALASMQSVYNELLKNGTSLLYNYQLQNSLKKENQKRVDIVDRYLLGRNSPRAGTYIDFLKTAGHPSLPVPPRPGVAISDNSSKAKKFVEKLRDTDVLCGRGGKSNRHIGNWRYRQVIRDMRSNYQHLELKKAKTQLSREIVKHVHSYGGRFLKQDSKTGKYFEMTENESRRKASQALRETKQLKWV